MHEYMAHHINICACIQEQSFSKKKREKFPSFLVTVRVKDQNVVLCSSNTLAKEISNFQKILILRLYSIEFSSYVTLQKRIGLRTLQLRKQKKITNQQKLFILLPPNHVQLISINLPVATFLTHRKTNMNHLETLVIYCSETFDCYQEKSL